jgi:cysteine desulfurase/selenocysteine lyase
MSTSNSLPPGFPDVATLERLANEFFSALPGSTGSGGAGNIRPSAPAGFSHPVAHPAIPATPPTVAVPPPQDSGFGPSTPASPGFSHPVAPPLVPGEAELRSLLAPCKLRVSQPGDSQFYFLPPPAIPGAAGSAAPAPVPPPAPAFDIPLPPGDSQFSFLPTPAVSSVAGAPTAAPAPLDVHAVRRDFPILSEQVNGRPLIWLDNAATTQKPKAVIDRLTYFYEHENSNIHRAAHTLAARATDAYEAAREKVRGFLNAASTNEIVFVRGATEAINLVAKTWGVENIGKDDEIVVSLLEHHANIVPWQQLTEQTGAKIRVIPVDDNGQIRLDVLSTLLGPRTKLLALAQVSNALGTITPAAQATAMAHAAGAKVLIDGAQSVSHLRADVQALDADFFVFSGHKVFAPTGIGVLYGKEAILNGMKPWQGGGNMIEDVTFEHTRYHKAPGRFEAGTGNIADAVGLGAAIDYVQRIGIENIAAYEHHLLEYATRLLRNIPGLRLIGTAPDKASVLSFVLAGHKTEDIGAALNREGIAVRSGHHCAQPILRRFGLESTVRPSLAFYNTFEEVDKLISVVTRIADGRSPKLA